MTGVDDRAAATAAAVLRVLADLSPAVGERTAALSVPTEWFRWLPAQAVRLFHRPPVAADGAVGAALAAMGNHPEYSFVTVERRFGERLAAIDQVRGQGRSLRVGWLFVAGRIGTGDGRLRRVFHPLVTVPVRLSGVHSITPYALAPAGDVELSELIVDHRRRFDLEGRLETGGGALDSELAPAIPPVLLARLGRLRQFAIDTAHAAGLPAGKLVPATEGPEQLVRHDPAVIVAGVAIYTTVVTGETSRASSLRAWADAGVDTWTALHALYLEDAPGSPPKSPPGSPPGPAEPRAEVGTLAPAATPGRAGRVDSPFLLAPLQRSAVAASRTAPITVMSGAPGTGKSHTIAAVVCDALGRGERVLVAAKSDATVDALLSLLQRVPGPDPVVFGSNERRDALAAKLSAGQLRPWADDEVKGAGQRVVSSTRHRDQLEAELAEALAAEQVVAGDGDDRAADQARRCAPDLFLPASDLHEAVALLAEVASADGGWFARWREHHAWRRLAALAGASVDEDQSTLREAVGAASAARRAGDLLAEGGLDLEGRWPGLLAAEDAVRDALGHWLALDSRSSVRLNHATLASVAVLATALRSGRAARREQLRRIKDERLTRALPLWVGTLADVDDLLPPVAGLFDLVILDEASSIDQSLAAPTLLRGRRAVVAGDPHQLRQVSFVSDAQMAAAVDANGLHERPYLGSLLDVRRNSAFDLAAAASPVIVLDEHFRCDPHLVEFVFDHLYQGRVKVATRSPRTQSRTGITVVRVDGARDADGIVDAEVQWVLGRLKELRRDGAASVGVVTPFRAQADALEKAILDVFGAGDLQAMDLRVGTVHAFQGNERDRVIVSLGIGTEGSASSWRFAEDSHLFAVMMTRAREHLELVLSADPPPGGLTAGYVAEADRPLGSPSPARSLSPWAESVAADLQSAGVAVLRAYPTGRHVIDVCVDDGGANRAIECDVHPDGPDAHIDRHLALVRQGWELLDGYRSRWGQRPGELVVNLVAALATPQQSN